MNLWKWFYPGLGFKRWLLLIILGLIMISSGVALLFDFQIVGFIEQMIFRLVFFLTGHLSRYLDIIAGVILLTMGLVIMGLSLKKVSGRVSQELLTDEELVDVFYQKKVLGKGPNIVAIGGGTGLSNLLRGLKNHTRNITAIVTVADDGGSSGKLRDELGILPPGDIRNCLVALADTEPLMEKLFQYRFSNEGHLVGHSFGNLFIASLTEVLGDFEAAVKESSKVLAIKGQVLPATNENVRLGAVYQDNTRKLGESAIPVIGKKIKRVFLEPESCQPTTEAIAALQEADIIVVGPGSLYTSILPNLLVNNIAKEIRKSRATRIYISNLMTQPGETTDYTVSDHLQALRDHVGPGLFDYIIVNREAGAESLARRYAEEGAFPVQFDPEAVADFSPEPVVRDLLIENGYIRHDPQKLARVILDISGDR